MNELTATFEDQSVRHFAPVLEFDHPQAGRVRVRKHPVRYSSGEATVRRVAPTLGEHTCEVLSELGCISAEIDTLCAEPRTA
jgi:crotonobetainyl-CoA:carnitine CoA-transferase CaiB-like acyl-CoA transferase